MNEIAVAFLAVTALALLLFPRRWAFVPLLAGVCYMTLGQEVELGAFHFSIFRLLIAVGMIRILVRHERLPGGVNGLDWVIAVWASLMCATSVLHADVSADLTTKLGKAYDACGVYLLLRVFCASPDDVRRLCRATAIVLLPVAAAMVYERMTLHNIFAVFGGVREIPMIREDRIRAMGPFAHPILAGTVGAVCVPFLAALWKQNRQTALLGGIACLLMIYSCASSGPIMSALVAIAAVYMWPYRASMRSVRWGAVAAYIALDIVMKDPAYTLIGRIDVTGGSTGWHRAELITASLKHLDEWWLGGTDYTRHWMPTGVSWSPDHTDITNHYLHMGVMGGFPLMLAFIAILVAGFRFVGIELRRDTPSEDRFLVWTLGSALFTHAMTGVSVSYFDQSILFLYMTLAAIGSLRHPLVTVSAASGSKPPPKPPLRTFTECAGS